MSAPETRTPGGNPASADSTTDRPMLTADTSGGNRRKADDGRIARAALAGFQLHRLADGRWLVHRWNLSRELADDAEVDSFLLRPGVKP